MGIMSFGDLKNKLVRVIHLFSCDNQISSCVSFAPRIPQVNMIHGYMPFTKTQCEDAVQMVEMKLGVRVLSRMRVVEEDTLAYQKGFKTKFEWTMGEANGSI